ncbi:MAG TPA: Ig-like domain-containing protein [Longimicrobiales bacterium]
MKSRFDASRFDSSLVGLQWALRFVILAMAILALAACSDDPTGSNDAIESVQVTAVATTLEAGDSVVVSAAPKRADGTTRTDVEVAWLSTDTSVAIVEGRAGQNAMVVAKKEGQVAIRAMVESKVGQTSLTVLVTEVPAPPPIVASIAPASATEGSELIELTVTGQNFSELSLVRWNGVAIPTQFISATELRGLISPANLAQVGTADVTVRTGPPGGGTSAGKPFTILSRVAAVRVTLPQNVLWVGEAAQLDAQPLDGSGSDLPKRTTTWSSSDETILTVDQQGTVTPLREGYAEVRAAVDGKVGSKGVYAFAAPAYDLMYDSNRGGGARELWIVSLGADATPRRWLPEGFNGEDPAINPAGTRIAFVSRDQYLNSDVWVANRDGSGLTRLTTYAGADDQPTWSPDGSKIAFRSMRSGQSQIWIMDADGSNQRNLMGTSQNLLDAQQQRPTFGPNGRIYFQVYYPYENRSLLGSMPVDGTWQQVVLHTPAGYDDSEPAVSWSGHNIVVRRKQGANDLGLLYLDLNGEMLYSINYPGRGFMPSWSRNDQYIAYSSSDDGLHAINVYITRQHDFWRKLITIGAAQGGGRNPIFIRR